MPPQLAHAVVRVRPDLTGFANALRTQLSTQLSAVGKEARTVVLTATFEQGTAAALQTKLNAMKLEVEVTPVLAPGAKAGLLERIGIIEDVPVTVKLAAGQAQKIEGEVAARAKAAAVPVAAAAPPATVVSTLEKGTAQKLQGQLAEMKLSAKVSATFEAGTKAKLQDLLTAMELRTRLTASFVRGTKGELQTLLNEMNLRAQVTPVLKPGSRAQLARDLGPAAARAAPPTAAPPAQVKVTAAFVPGTKQTLQDLLAAMELRARLTAVFLPGTKGSLQTLLDAMNLRVRLLASFQAGTKGALQGLLDAMNLKAVVTPRLKPGSKAQLLSDIGAIEGVPVTTKLTGPAARAAAAAPAPVLPAAAIPPAPRVPPVPPPAVVTSGVPLPVLEAERARAGALEQQIKARAELNALEATGTATEDALAVATAHLETKTRALTLETEKLVLAREKAAAPSVAAVAGVGPSSSREAANAARQAELSMKRLAAADTATAEAEAALARGITTDTEAIKAGVVADEAMTQITRELSAAVRSEDRDTIAAIESHKARLVQIQEEITARQTLLGVSQRAGVLGGALATPIVTAASGADRETLAKQAKAAAETEALAQLQLKEVRAAATIGNEIASRAVINLAKGEEGLAVTQLAQANAAKIATEAEVAHGAVLEQIAVLERRIGEAVSPDLNLVQQRRALVAVEKQLVITLEEYQKANSGVNASDIESIKLNQLKVAGLKETIAAQIQAEASAAKVSEAQQRAALAGQTTIRQAERGAAATGATFLGLRGAVLSASTGFLAATVGITALSKIVATAEQLQHSLDIFRSVSGATADEMARVDEQARLLGGDLSLPATSATDAADAMTELAKAGLSVNETIDASKGVLQLAAAAGISVGDAATIVATELNAFGLAGDQATKVVDLLAGASIAAQGDITDFSLAFQQVAAVAHQVQLPIQTTTAILTQFAKAGLHGSDAGTSLRTLLLRLVPTSKAAADAQNELGIKINRNIPIGHQFVGLVNQYTAALAKLSPVAQQEILTKIFGQDAIRGASISLTQGARALTEIQSAVTKQGTAAELTRGRTEGLGGAVEGLKSEVSTLAGTIGNAFLPTLESTAHTFAAIASNANAAFTEVNKFGNITIKPVGNFFGGSDTGVKIVLAGIAAIAARRLIAGDTATRILAKEKTAVLEVNAALAEGKITQEQVNHLWDVMGIKAEDARGIQLQVTADLEAQQKSAAARTAGLIKLEKELAVARAETAPFVAQAAPIASLAVTEAAQAGVSARAQALIPQAPTMAASQRLLIQAQIAEAAGSREISDALLAQAVAAEKVEAAFLKGSLVEVEAQAKVLIAAGKTAEAEALIGKAAVEAAVKVRLAAASMVASNGLITTSALRAAGAEGSIGPAAPTRLGRLGQRLTALTGSRGTAIGLGAGIAAELAGGAIGGRAGGVISAAGLGTQLGSFVPLPIPGGGAIPGAVLFGLADFLKQSIQSSNEAKEKLKKQWEAMTFAQQQEFLVKRFPRLADPNASLTVLQESIKDTIKQSINVDTGPTAPKQFTLPGEHPGLIEPGNINLLNRPPVKVGKDLGTVFSVSFEVDGKEVLAPRIYNGRLHSVDEAVAHAIETGQNLGTFGASPGRTAQQNVKAFANLVHQQQADLASQTLSPGLLGRFKDPTLDRLQETRANLVKTSISTDLTAEGEKNLRASIARLDIEIKARTTQVHHLRDTAAGFIQEMGGLNIPHAQFSIFVDLPTDFEALNKQLDDAIFAQDKTKEKLLREEIARAELQEALKNLFAPGTTLKAAGLSVSPIAQAKTQVVLSQKEMDALNLAIAQATGSDADVRAALQTQAKHQLQTLNILKKQFSQNLISGAITDLGKQAAEIIKAAQAYGATRQQLDQVLKSDVFTFAFSVPTQIAAIQAGTTKTLVDNLANQETQLAEINTALRHANERLDKGVKDAQKQVDDLRIKQAQAGADISTTQQQISDQAVQNTNTRLQRAADAAGNVGAAEDKYIAFLRGQVGTSGQLTSERLTAEGNLKTEQDKHTAAVLSILQDRANKADNLGAAENKFIAALRKQVQITDAHTAARRAAEDALTAALKTRDSALQAVADARQGLKTAFLDNLLAKALRTPEIADEIKAYRLFISDDLKRIEALKKVVNADRSSQLQKLDAATKIANLRGDIAQRLESIKSATAGTGGVTLEQLFAESIKELNDFGSNVTGSVQTAASARAALAAGILTQKQGLSPGEQQQISQAAEGNDLLRQILEAIRRSGQQGKPLPNPDPRPSTLQDPVGIATALKAQHLAGLT